VKEILVTYKPLILFAFIITIIIFCIWQNNSIVITKSDYANAKIPIDFDDYKVVHISDFHNKNFGKNQRKILDKIEAILPDIIVITGDLIDRRKYDLDVAMVFIKGAVDIAPVYYVSGNHEVWSGKFSSVEESLKDAGVVVMDNGEERIYKNNSWINIFGLRDPDFHTSSYFEDTKTIEILENLNKWSGYEGFKILLSHRPELFDLYSNSDMDLIFTGHAHGGQIRIPFLGGLIAPDQGLFPKYTSGSYHKDSSTMFVSRGLGNSVFPIRIFNRPEILLVTIKSGS